MSHMPRKPLVVGGQEVPWGQRRVVRLPVTLDLDGSQITISVHVLAGAEAGPTLSLLCGLHGGEWLPIEFLRRVVAQVDPTNLRGNLLVVPVANPVAFAAGTRNTPDISDCPDLNRAFGNEFNWITSQLARTLVEEVLRRSDYMMDFHGGGFGRVMFDNTVPVDVPNKRVVAESLAMAKAFGCPVINPARVCGEFPGPRSSFGYAAAVLGIPNCGPEVGGAGFDEALEERWIGENVFGTLNVMKSLGMVEGRPILPARYLLYLKRWRVNPNVGGYLHALVKPAETTKPVKEGELLGRVVSPYSFEEVEQLRAPGDGYILYGCRSYPVRPGYWAYAVIDGRHPATLWVEEKDFPLTGEALAKLPGYNDVVGGPA